MALYILAWTGIGESQYDSVGLLREGDREGVSDRVAHLYWAVVVKVPGVGDERHSGARRGSAVEVMVSPMMGSIMWTVLSTTSKRANINRISASLATG